MPTERALAAQTLKGTLFVLLSAGLLYWLLRREEAGLVEAYGELEEARLRESAIFEGALEGIVITDAEGRIVEANPEAARIHDRTVDEMIGLRGADFAVDPEESHRIREQMAEKGALQGELTMRRPDGSHRRVEYTARAQFVPGHNLVLLRDVTTRYGAQLAVRESERTYRLLFEHHPHPAHVYDPKTLRLLAVNREMVATYGYSREELLQMTLRDLRPPSEVPYLESIFAAGLDSNTRHPAKHQTKEGRILEVDTAAQAIEFQGRPARMVVITDRTEESRLREQLHHSQRLEALGRLAGGVAHDFNNLLTVISGFSDLLVHHLEEDDTGRSQVEQIREAARRAARLTDQLLAFGRRQLMRPKVVDLNQIVRDLETLLHRVLGEQIELVTRLTVEPAWVRADPGRLEQVLVNLAVNARDAMPEGGRLTLVTSQADVDEEQARKVELLDPGRFAVVTVRDTGHGIPPEDLEQIFEPFFTTKEVGKGTGLGLSTAYGIARQSGGFLTVDSTVDEGSAFHLFLPQIVDMTPEAPAAHRPAEGLEGKEQVLVVEDQEQVRGLVVRSLEHWGYRVYATGDAHEARKVMARNGASIDLLVTDIGLPGERGPDLARSLRTRRPDLPVLFISGHAAESSDAEQDLDGEQLLQKPFTALDLARRVREMLDLRR